MSRTKRDKEPEEIYHVFSRGNRKQNIFITEKHRHSFINYVADAKNKYKTKVLMYCLMGNHYHMVIQNSDNQMSEFMKSINQRFAHLFNALDNKPGRVFQDRFKSIHVSNLTYLSTLFAYIHLNPVKDNFTRKPEDWKWSSYKSYLTELPDKILDKEVLFGQYAEEGKALEIIFKYMHNKYTREMHEHINLFLESSYEQRLPDYIEILQNNNQKEDSRLIALREDLGISYGLIAKLSGMSKSGIWSKLKSNE